MLRIPVMIIGLFMLLMLSTPSFSQTNFWERTSTEGASPCNVNTLSATETEICAATHEGIFCSNDGGESWISIRPPLSASLQPVHVFLKLDNNRFIASQMTIRSDRSLSGAGPHYSHDGGNTWSQIVPRSAAWSLLALPDGRLFISEHGPTSLGFGVGVSADSGRSWVSMIAGLGVSPDIYSVRLTPNGAILASSFIDLFRLAPGDTTWSSLGLGILSPIWTALETPNGTLFAVTGDYWQLGNGIMHSTNGGSNWLHFNNGLTDFKVRDLVLDTDGRLWAATVDSGVFVSPTADADWQPQNSGLDNLHVNDLVFGPSGRLYAGTEDGVYRSEDLSITSVQTPKAPVPNKFDLEQNYPNPFNPTTKITYSIPQAGNIELKIFNLVGQEVRTLVKTFQRSGSYTVAFDAANLASGVYIYRLRINGQFQQNKKMLLIR